MTTQATTTNLYKKVKIKNLEQLILSFSTLPQKNKIKRDTRHVTFHQSNSNFHFLNEMTNEWTIIIDQA